MVNTPQLGAPGDGLPWYELFFAKAFFGLYCFKTTTRQALQKFEEEASLTRLLLNEFSADDRTRKILVPRVFGIEDSSRNWSVAMLLAHVAIVNKGIHKIVESLLREQGGLPIIEIAKLKPPEGSAAEALERFEQSVANYVAFIKQAETVKSRATHIHPWFGPMNAHGWHCLAGVHLCIHRRQLGFMAALQ